MKDGGSTGKRAARSAYARSRDGQPASGKYGFILILGFVGGIVLSATIAAIGMLTAQQETNDRTAKVQANIASPVPCTKAQ